MEQQVIFYNDMDIDPADWNNVQTYVRQAMDHVVKYGISADRKYAGFAAAQTSSVEISAQAGLFFSGGMVFVRDEIFTKNFATSLPLTTKKNILLVAYGQEVETNAQPREFLKDEESGQSEPRTVALTRVRRCSITTVAGLESPDPTDPLLDEGVIAIARISLTPAGVASVEMLTENQLVSIADVDNKVAVLEDFQNRTGSKLISLSSDIAALKSTSKGNVSQVSFGRALVRLATLEELNGVPSDALDSDTDFFLDTEESDLAHASSNCLVAEGIRFADQANDDVALNIFDPLNPNATINSGILFPRYTREKRSTVGPRQGEVQAAAYTYQTHSMKQRTMSRTRIRYGTPFTVCTNAGWWGAVTDQYIPRTFQHDGETFETLSVDWDGPNHGWVRVREYWEDDYQETYWDAVTVDHSVPGAQIAETFLNANDMWLDAVGLTLTKLAGSGTITLAICEVDRGMPALDRAISVTTVDRPALSVNVETVIPIQPVFLEKGTRYAIVIVTAADYWFATTGGANFPEGTFFTVLDGAYQQGDGTRDLCFSLYAAKFAQSRAVIALNTLQLAGGIAAIDILADAVRPKSTDLSYEIQIAGIWHPLAKGGSILGSGGSIPPSVPLRAVFTGTPDVMPALRLTGSNCHLSRPNVAMTHVSQIRSLPGSGSDEIVVIGRLESFDAAHHTATAKLRTGAGYTTIVAASSHSDETDTDGSIVRTWLFNLGAPVTSFRIQLEGTTDSQLNTFHYAYRKDYAAA